MTLSRLSADLLLWTTVEFGFLALPDSLVGSSSIMPQKRNPYLLEHVQGRSAKPLGALVSAITAMQGKPFTNNIAAGTESVSGVWDAFANITSALHLARVTVMGAVPRQTVMLRRAEGGFLEATEICNRLVLAGVPFRAAHHLVGRAITESLEQGESADVETLISRVAAVVPDFRRQALDPEHIMRASSHGGGPGATLRRDGFEHEVTALRAHSEGLRRWVDQWRAARRELDLEVARLCGGVTDPGRSPCC